MAQSAGSTTSSVYNAVVCPGHIRPVVHVEYSRPTPDGVFVISACLDSKPMIRAADTGDWIGTLEGHKGAVWSASLDNSALHAVTGSADFGVRVWDALTGECMQEFTAPHIVKAVAFNAAGTCVYSGGLDKGVKRWDLSTGASTDCHKFEQPVRAVVQAGDQTMVAAAACGSVILLDERSNDAAAKISLAGPLSNVRVGGSGRRRLVCSHEDSVTVLDLSNGTEIATIKTGLPNVCSAALFPDDKNVLVTCENTSLHMFDLTSGKQETVFKGHHGRLWDVDIHPDGKDFATAADDATVRVWKHSPGT